MNRMLRSIVLVAAISSFSIIGPNYLNVLSSKVYAMEAKPCLKSIYLSEGNKINFDENVYSYVVDVDKDVEDLVIKAKPYELDDTVIINGKDVSGIDSYRDVIELNKGKNKIEIEVKDSKTNATSKYTVYVYRGGKDAVYLKDINIDGSNIGFENSTNSYNIELDEGTKLAELQTVPYEGNYSVTVNGVELGENNSIKLKFGGIGKYTINVGLKDKDTEREGKYTLNIYLGIPVTPNVEDAINDVLKPNQWVIVNGRWRYNDVLGKPLKDTWFYDNKYGSYFHFNNRGNMQTGWINDEGNWYYLKQSGEMQKGWLEYENKWYFLDDNGVMRTDWVEVNDKWYFFGKDGEMETGWIFNNGNWYFLKFNGFMETGWIYYGKKWYFLNSHGAMETGWIQINNEWYFLNDDGSMKAGEWLYYNSNWYYLLNDGNMRHDNIYDTVRRGWLYFEDIDKIYFFNEDGTMRTTPITIDGYTYNFNEDGSVS